MLISFCGGVKNLWFELPVFAAAAPDADVLDGDDDDDDDDDGDDDDLVRDMLRRYWNGWNGRLGSHVTIYS